MNWNIVILIILLCIIFFGVGYSKGAHDTLTFGIRAAIVLIDKNKLNITVDENMIVKGIEQYENQIRNCLFLEDDNAPVLSE